MDREALIHFIGGAVGGTTGTCITCPLEVVKTRMQSSTGISPLRPSTSQGKCFIRKIVAVIILRLRFFEKHQALKKASVPITNFFLVGHLRCGIFCLCNLLESSGQFGTELPTRLGTMNIVSRNPNFLNLSRFIQSQAREQHSTAPRKRLNTIHYFSYIIRNEGFGALYKGLIPNLVGVAPSKAVYFYSYSTSKRILNDSKLFVPNSAIVHMVSAGSAGTIVQAFARIIRLTTYCDLICLIREQHWCIGFVAATAVNPIWLVKTRLQLYHGKSTVPEMIRRVYRREGIKGFYKGVTASYAGVSETMIQFVIYEHLREVVRTRLREESAVKRGFFATLYDLYKEGVRSMYRGLSVQVEVVRTRLREESAVKRGFFATLYDLYKEGVRSMYRGLSVQVGS
ncbi:hypothetical protein DICVIV_12835 [Dictyocaulus viviparus]|uniref:Uncharacterized protein n=1 Tax=Dictyocaulus viviparus TaxID=29172 RepID=A0A0D8XFR7_DICVI|nr:hypothetical protein DICVIV_12835 [Dictyocaulus viviparus]